MKIKLFLLLLISFIAFFDSSAQKNNKKITITGRVTDLYSSPVSGALIMIDGKNTTAKTDAKGFYKIKVKSPASQIGVFTITTGVKEEPVNGRTVVNFNLDKIITLQPGIGTGGAPDLGGALCDGRAPISLNPPLSPAQPVEPRVDVIAEGLARLEVVNHIIESVRRPRHHPEVVG